jgi:hypothetical protein
VVLTGAPAVICLPTAGTTELRRSERPPALLANPAGIATGTKCWREYLAAMATARLLHDSSMKKARRSGLVKTKSNLTAAQQN